MEEPSQKFINLLNDRLDTVKAIFEVNCDIIKLMEQTRFESSYELIEKRSLLISDMELLNNQINNLNNENENFKFKRIKKILALNEPGNLNELEKIVLCITKEFANVIREVLCQDKTIKELFEQEREQVMQELSKIVQNKNKILHSRQFVDTFVDVEQSMNYDIKS